MEGWTERQVTIDGVTFDIGKLLPEECFQLYETMRPVLEHLVEAASGVDDDDPNAGLLVAVKFFSRIPRDIVAQVQRTLFKVTTYSTPDQKAQMTLAGDESNAFKTLDAIHYYEVLARCLAINFIGSWVALKSRVPGAETFIAALGREISIHSSPDQSTQVSAD